MGAGHVGATTCYALMLRALFEEIVLIDSDPAHAEAEAEDISQANALARPTTIRSGSYADAATASIAVLTAGGAPHGTESRLSVAGQSLTIVTDCAHQLSEAGFAGVLVVAANPVDLMALAAFKHSDLPASRVIGSGTLLDSARFRRFLASRLALGSDAVDGYVLGEHGDSEVAAFSTVRIGGLALEDFPHLEAAIDRGALATDVREAGYRIVKGKGYTSFGIATSLVRICEAILRDERCILPVSTLLTGQLDIHDVYLSLPCVIGATGVDAILIPSLPGDEKAALGRSAELLRKMALELGLLPKRLTTDERP